MLLRLQVLLGRLSLMVLDSLHVDLVHVYVGLLKLDPAVLANDALPDVAQGPHTLGIEVIELLVDHGLGWLAVGAHIGLGSLAGLLRFGAATLLRPHVDWYFVDYFWLGVVDVPDPQSDPPHPNDRILLQLQTLGLERLLGVLTHHVPQLLLRIGVDALKIHLVLVVEPVPFGARIRFRRLLEQHA